MARGLCPPGVPVDPPMYLGYVPSATKFPTIPDHVDQLVPGGRSAVAENPQLFKREYYSYMG